MLALINELSDMPDWHRKIFDNDFMFKWKSEKLMTGQDITRSMADWVRSEPILSGKMMTNPIYAVRRGSQIPCIQLSFLRICSCN